MNVFVAMQWEDYSSFSQTVSELSAIDAPTRPLWVILLAFGVLTGMDGPRVQANLPTPWLGVWERISIAADMLWVAVLAITLLRVKDIPAVTGRHDTLAA